MAHGAAAGRPAPRAPAPRADGDPGGERWVGRLRKVFIKPVHSFGYLECLEADDDAFVYLADLAEGLGQSVRHMGEFVAELFEFTPQRNSRGVKATGPFARCGDFEGREELERELDQRLRERLEGLGVVSDESDSGALRAYEGRLRRDLAEVFRLQGEDLRPANLADRLRHDALRAWRPDKAFAGLSLGAWVGGLEQAERPKSAKQFAEASPGVRVWNSKGNPYAYPVEVFRMLNSYGESDIERASKDPSASARWCGGCGAPRLVGREDPHDGVWRCVSCFIAWYGLYPWTDRGVETMLARGPRDAPPRKAKAKKPGKRRS